MLDLPRGGAAGGSVCFSLNGVNHGEAFTLPTGVGVMYPAVCMKNAQLGVCFGAFGGNETGGASHGGALKGTDGGGPHGSDGACVVSGTSRVHAGDSHHGGTGLRYAAEAAKLGYVPLGHDSILRGTAGELSVGASSSAATGKSASGGSGSGISSGSGGGGGSL